MSTDEIAQELVDKCRAGAPDQALNTLYADDAVSIEAMAPPGMDATSRGKAAIVGKNQWWRDNHDVSGAQIEGPFINGDQFAVHFTMDVTVKASGNQMHMTEIGLYTVKDGKIVEERFLYGR